MWKLSARGERGSPFAELGSYASLGDAARTILATENDPSLGAIFFRVYVDPVDPPSDAKALSRLEYQSAKRFYLLTRDAH
jgi:hypothetical protein